MIRVTSGYDGGERVWDAVRVDDGGDMAKLILPPGIRYTCIRCGACCRSLEVTLTDAEHERLAGRDWSGDVAGATTDGLFARIRRPRGKQTWRLRPRPDGPCRLLDEAGLCRVHSALGYAAKPFAGRLFPFRFTVTPEGVFVGVRFNCPAVVHGKGPLLEQQKGEIAELYEEYARTYGPPRAREQVHFFGRLALGWRDVLRLEEQLLAFLVMRDVDLPRRLLACQGLVRGFAQQAAGGGERSRVGADPNAILDEVRGPLEARPLRAIERRMLRLFAASFIGATPPSYRELPLVGRLGTRLGNFVRRTKIGAGVGRIRLPMVAERASVRRAWAMDKSRLAPASSAMLERYFVAKVASQDFFGQAFFGRPFAEGFDFLAASYWAVLWLAAAHASAKGRESLEPNDVAYGIGQVDYAYNYLGEFGGRAARLRSAVFWHWDTVGAALAGLASGA